MSRRESESARRTLRVAEVVRPAAGGIRRHIATLLVGLDRHSFTPTLFAPADFALSEVDVPRVPLAIAARTQPFADLRTIRQLEQLLAGKFDIVHAHGLRGALIGVLAAHRAGVPSLFTAHNLVPRSGLLQRSVLVLIGRHASAILAVSEAVAATLQESGIPAEKIVVIPNGVDLADFDAPVETAQIRAQFGVPADAPLILAVGRFAPEKGFDVLIDAFARLQAQIPHVKLMLVGSGPLEEELRRRAASAGEGVVFAGQQADVAPFLHAADLVAIPSRQEGQGIVALEAMAARKPVVASRVGGLAETIVPDETGLLVPPEETAALAEALAGLLQDRAKREAMGAKGRQRVEKEYTAAQMVRRIEAVYERIGTKT
jgi:glycosyltransferase involved in cell wall biosynthesis